MMREVLTRRFSRLLKEHGERDPARGRCRERTDQPAVWPDLVLIDGGQGQLERPQWRCWHDLGHRRSVASRAVAKGPDRDAGREHFYLPGKPSFMLEPRDPVLYYHPAAARRGAPLRHRQPPGQARQGDVGANPLDEIAGIGPRAQEGACFRPSDRPRR